MLWLKDGEEDVFAEAIIGKTMCEAADEGSMKEVELAIGRKERIDIQDPVNMDSALCPPSHLLWMLYLTHNTFK